MERKKHNILWEQGGFCPQTTKNGGIAGRGHRKIRQFHEADGQKKGRPQPPRRERRINDQKASTRSVNATVITMTHRLARQSRPRARRT